MRPALLINPNAWLNAKDPSYRGLLRRAFDGLGDSAETSNADEVAPLLRAWRAQGVDLLVVSGGDGVFHRVVQEMLSVWPSDELPAILPLHGGTIGVIARASNSPSPVAAISLLRLALSSGQSFATKPLATLLVGERAVFNFGVGVFSSVTQEYAARSWRGPLGVQRVIAKMVASCVMNGEFAQRALRPWRGEILLDGERAEANELAGVYATGLNNMWEFKGFPKQDAPPGKFRTMQINTNPRGFAKGLLPFTMGWNIAVSPVRFRVISEMQVSSDEPYVYLADGEFYEQQAPLLLRSGPMIHVLQW